MRSFIFPSLSPRRQLFSLMGLFVVCFLVALGGGVFYDAFILFGGHHLALQDISAFLAHNLLWAMLSPLAVCVLWVARYLAIRRFFGGQGHFLTHGWADFVCFTPCVVVLVCLSPLPMNNVFLQLLNPLLPFVLSLCVLNIWMLTIIHHVKWDAVFISTLLGGLALPVAFFLFVFFSFMFGVISIPPQS